MENFLNIFLLGDVPNDLVSFSFFIGTMAMMAASVFFFLSLDAGGGKWRTSMLTAGLITFIAAVHYYYMRDANVAGADTTFFRYVDWILTVPLMCVEFYLILAKAGATKKLMWNLIFASTVMLVCGYIGETGDNPVLWGTASGLAYFWVAYTVWLGEAKGLAEKAGGAVLEAHNALCWFVLVGWAIYPIGYMIGTADGAWYSFMGNIGVEMDLVYNIGDAINKIGFGLVVYNLAVSK